MRIAYISNSIIPSRTANSIHIMKMCSAFVMNGNEVFLIIPDRLNETELDVTDEFDFYGVKKNFKIIKVPYNSLKYYKTIKFALDASKIVDKLKPEQVYGRDLISCYFCSNKTNTIFEAHKPMNNFIKKIIFNRLQNKKKYTKTVVISDALKQIIIKEQKVESLNILVSHDAADQINDFKGILSPSKKIRVGYFGHLYKGRGIDIIIDSAQKLKNIEFHIVGGNENDISYWRRQVKSENIIFHGFISPKNVYKYRNSCDILLAPYQKEVAISGGSGNTVDYMSPLKIFEYMSSKKSIISSNLPVLNEVLNEQNSILVNPEDLDEWVTAITKLLNEDLRNKIASKAYSDFQKKYSWEKRALRLLTK